MTAVEILESGKLYTDAELRKLLSGHLCRCTGYENILRAVKKGMPPARPIKQRRPKLKKGRSWTRAEYGRKHSAARLTELPRGEIQSLYFC